MYGQNEPWFVSAYYCRPRFVCVPLLVTSRKSMCQIRKHDILLQFLQNSSTLLDQKDWSVINLSSFWVVWIVRLEVYCSWFSRGRMLKRVYDWTLGINIFLDMKGKTFTRLTDLGWMCNFAFFVYITQCLNDLNSYLQGTNQLTSEISAKMK
jgi:hypothetical protein